MTRLFLATCTCAMTAAAQTPTDPFNELMNGHVNITYDQATQNGQVAFDKFKEMIEACLNDPIWKAKVDALNNTLANGNKTINMDLRYNDDAFWIDKLANDRVDVWDIQHSPLKSGPCLRGQCEIILHFWAERVFDECNGANNNWKPAHQFGLDQEKAYRCMLGLNDYAASRYYGAGRYEGQICYVFYDKNTNMPTSTKYINPGQFLSTTGDLNHSGSTGLGGLPGEGVHTFNVTPGNTDMVFNLPLEMGGGEFSSNGVATGQIVVSAHQGNLQTGYLSLNIQAFNITAPSIEIPGLGATGTTAFSDVTTNYGWYQPATGHFEIAYRGRLTSSTFGEFETLSMASGTWSGGSSAMQFRSSTSLVAVDDLKPELAPQALRVYPAEPLSWTLVAGSLAENTSATLRASNAKFELHELGESTEVIADSSEIQIAIGPADDFNASSFSVTGGDGSIAGFTHNGLSIPASVAFNAGGGGHIFWDENVIKCELHIRTQTSGLLDRHLEFNSIGGIDPTTGVVSFEPDQMAGGEDVHTATVGYMAGCDASVNGPELVYVNTPVLGTTLVTQGVGTEPNLPWVGLLAGDRLDPPVPVDELFSDNVEVGAQVCVDFIDILGSIPAVSSPGDTVENHYMIPNDPAIIGASLYSQWVNMKSVAGGVEYRTSNLGKVRAGT